MNFQDNLEKVRDLYVVLSFISIGEFFLYFLVHCKNREYFFYFYFIGIFRNCWLKIVKCMKLFLIFSNYLEENPLLPNEKYSHLIELADHIPGTTVNHC